MQKILELLSQQSTWKGIISVATAFGVVLSPEQSSAIIATGLAVIGLINVFINKS